jgi:hypothetical protein
LEEELEQLFLSCEIGIGHECDLDVNALLTTMSSESPCYTVVFDSSSESPSLQELRAGLEKGSDEVKIDTLRKILVSTINGNPHVRSFFVSMNQPVLNHSLASLRC